MSHLICKHCGKTVNDGDKSCLGCGIPLPPKHGQQVQKNFVFWFVAVVLFCFFMMFWLPPDWSPLVSR